VRKVDARIAQELEFHEEELRNWLATYQQTNIDIFRHYTMLPLRFGMMVDQKEDIEDFLTGSYLHIKWALDRLRGKAEFTVQLSWDLSAVLQEISQDGQWLDGFKGSIDPADKIQVGRLLFRTADAKKKEIVASAHHKLAGVSLDSSDGGCVNDLVIMDRSYLIQKSAEEAFDRAMAELGEENESYLNFKYVGPIPPYSFAPVEFRRGNFELIDEARRRLSLPERALLEDIKASYRKLALKYHPDKNPGERKSSQRFRKMDEAYKILETYCHSCSGSLTDGRDMEYSFAESDVEEVFIVERTLAR